MTTPRDIGSFWSSLCTSTTISGGDDRQSPNIINQTLRFSVSLGVPNMSLMGIRLTILEEESIQSVYFLNDERRLSDVRISKRRWHDSYANSRPGNGANRVLDLDVIVRADGNQVLLLTHGHSDTRQHLRVLRKEFLPSSCTMLRLRWIRTPFNFHPNRLITNSLTHLLTILPIQSARRFLARLPGSVITRVIKLLFDTQETLTQNERGLPWSSIKYISTLARISKAWLHALDIVWDYAIGSPLDPIPMPNVHLLTKSVEKNIHIAHKFRVLAFYVVERSSPWWEIRTDKSWTEQFGGLTTRLVGHCPNIVAIQVSTLQFYQSAKAFRRLKRVERLHIESDTRLASVGQDMRLEDLFYVIQGWPALDDLYCSNWDTSGSPAEAFSVATFSLSSLKLVRGFITLSDLTFLASNPSQHIRLVKLNDLRGLTHEDLTTFFSLLSPTLEDLEVTACNILPPLPGNNRALDIAVSNMSRLRAVKVESTLATYKSISRKRSRSPSNPAICLTIEFSNINHAINFFNIPPPCGDCDIREVGAKRLALAVEKTGWKCITFVEDGWWKMTKDDRKIILSEISRKAELVAEERGIVMKGFGIVNVDRVIRW